MPQPSLRAFSSQAIPCGIPESLLEAGCAALCHLCEWTTVNMSWLEVHPHKTVWWLVWAQAFA